MKLSPHELIWLADYAEFTGNSVLKDPVSGLLIPNRIMFAAVSLAESEGDTDAMHRSADATSSNFGQYDHGIMQMSGRWNGDKIQRMPDWRDPRVNAKLAKQLWDETQRAKGNGWLAWAVVTSLSFQKRLPDAHMGALFPFPPPSPRGLRFTVEVIKRSA